MKKKLEAELISIAHRILKLNNKSDLIRLQQEARNVYEKLSVLLFVEENFATAQPTIGKSQVYETLETAFNEKVPAEEAPVVTDADKKAETAPQELAAEEKTAAEADDKKEAVAEKAAEQEVESPDVATTDEKSEEAEKPKEILNETESTNVEEPAKSDESVKSKEPEPSDEPKESEEPKQEEEPIKPEIPEKSVVEAGIEYESSENQAEVAKAELPEQEIEKKADLFKPTFDWGFEPKDTSSEKPKETTTPAHVAFEDLLGSGYKDPVFVKPEDLEKENQASKIVVPEPTRAIFEQKIPEIRRENSEIADRTVSINDRLSKGITVGLNDRIAFVKHLFGGSNEEYNRVLSQLITFNSFAEAQEFIDNMVKPDYNNWDGKEEYAVRFMEVVEKKFT